MTTEIVLRKAAWIIEQRGWARYAFVTEDGKVDAYAAIAAATKDGGERNAARKAVERLVGEPIVLWNDYRAATAENVVATLRRAGGER